MRRLCVLSFCMLLLCGCGQADPAVTAARQQFVSQASLQGEVKIPDIRKAASAEDADKTKSWVIRAKINAGEFPPFADGLASFIVTDAFGTDDAEHKGGADHNPHDCPFCKRDINSVMARVEFCGADGAPLPLDARQLFDLQEMQLVQVEGTARKDDDDWLVISARRIHVVR